MGGRTTALLLLLSVMAAPAAAQGLLGKVQVHGFGTWAYGDTDGNSYLFADRDGNYDNASFAINLSSKASDRLTIAGQVEWVNRDDGLETELDFIFAEWAFSDRLRLRFGQVKHPFGIYTEVFSVGTVRPFLNLPQGVYGPQGMISESYRGVGVVGAVYGSAGWGLEYDLYAGEVRSRVDHPFFITISEVMGAVVPSLDLDYTDSLGIRLNLMTPVEGLSFGLSAYTGEPDPNTATPHPMQAVLDLGHRRKVYGVHCEYESDRWWIRSEYVSLSVGSTDLDGAYAELAYRFTDNWQVAGRYDWSEVAGVDPGPYAAYEILDHRDLAVAVNYWFTAGFVIKTEYHMVDGNRLMAPPVDELPAALMTGQIDTETNVLQVGAQFSF